MRVRISALVHSARDQATERFTSEGSSRKRHPRVRLWAASASRKAQIYSSLAASQMMTRHSSSGAKREHRISELVTLESTALGKSELSVFSQLNYFVACSSVHDESGKRDSPYPEKALVGSEDGADSSWRINRPVSCAEHGQKNCVVWV